MFCDITLPLIYLAYMKIAMLVSGGVDSSVALRLLKDAGHDVTAFYLKIWLEDELQYLGNCPWEEDLSYVERICKAANVPLQVISMQKEYWDRVVRYTIAECKAGRTPNPDIFCNQQIKFGQFYSKIDDFFEKVATGHYAQISHKCECGSHMCICPYLLKKAPDPVKDQTYFLSYLSQKQLSRALFPIGHLKKEEVRALAKQYDLPNKSRKDSQGICFLGKIPYREFIKEHLGEMPGDFINQKTGESLGEHKGHWFYTIGQRFGLGLSGGPWFVVQKDIEKNLIYLANGYDPDEVYGDHFSVKDMNWISPIRSADLKTLQVKIRHGAKSHPCMIEMDGDLVKVKLLEKIHGIAAGQFAVFYRGEYCLGGGKIV